LSSNYEKPFRYLIISYSPLEQFEPIPFITIFFGGVNFSITNVTIIFIYIVLVLSYFLNGYLFNINKIKLIKFVHLKKGVFSSRNENYLNLLKKFYNLSFIYNILSFHSNKLVSYLNFLSSSYKANLLNKFIKENWLGLNILALPSLKSEYSREFHKVFFISLKNKDVFSLINNYNFFNNIQLYFGNFLNNLYFGLINLNFLNLKKRFKINNIFYFFSTSKKFLKSFVPNFNIYVFENIYNIILNMVKENIGGSSLRVVRFFPFILSLFLFVLIANLIGLIPYSSTVTSYLIVTFAMAIMVLIGVNMVAGRFHGLVYFGHFLPAGCPFALYPLIIPIEFISYIFRVVSLSVRLFANMMAGHTLLAVLAGFGWSMVNGGPIIFWFHVLPVFVVFVLVFLETAVAIIQAYVFTILTCMYLDEAINLH
jgi:ATP synthase subunit 6